MQPSDTDAHRGKRMKCEGECAALNSQGHSPGKCDWLHAQPQHGDG